MTQETKKEALFNEVKGSLFEYLVARKIACLDGNELEFQKSIDHHYLNVLAQQDRLVRQFYPDMSGFLSEVSDETVSKLVEYLKEQPASPRLLGKFVNSSLSHDLHEADLLLQLKQGSLPVSLKLTKKNAYINTKSGGVKSFFSQYFSFLPLIHQSHFNQQVDLEFSRMAQELHELHELDYCGSFSNWTKARLSELPGELDPADRAVLKGYYARIARLMFDILQKARDLDSKQFGSSLAALMGFNDERILMVICFHGFKDKTPSVIEVHPFSEIAQNLPFAKIRPFSETSSVEIEVGNWSLQIRVKPMNKFTTTAIKINCSVKIMPPNDA